MHPDLLRNSDLTELWHHAYGHLLANRRDALACRVLKEALALFHGNRLAAALRTVETLELSRSTVMAFCDLPIEAAFLPERVRAWLWGHGIRFGGELFRFDWERLATRHKEAERVRVLLVALGFPSNFDSREFGWQPAYLADPAVHAALNASWVVFARDMDPWDPNPLLAGHPGGIVRSRHYVGAFMRAFDLRSDYAMAVTVEWQAKIEPVPELAPLHAAMFLPESWSPPAETCPEWDAYAARERRAKAFAAAHGRPVGINEGFRAWSVPGATERRAALASAMREEGMSPHFFDQVLFNVPVHAGGGHYYSRRSARCDTKSVRAFLALSWAEVARQSDYSEEIVRCLGFWGLKLGMTEAEIDELFG